MAPGSMTKSAKICAAICSLGLLLVLVIGASREAFYAIVDDAYIYFRYVRNFVDGCGVTYTCGGEYVEGFTSPAYFLTLSVAHLLIDDIELIATSLGFLGGWLALTLTILIPWQFEGHDDDGDRGDRVDVLAPGLLSSVAFVVLASDWNVISHTVTGMEVWFGWLATIALLSAAILDMRKLLIIVVMTAPLVRPEYAVFFALAPAFFPVFRKPRTLLIMALFVGTVAMVRWGLFGEVLPNTFHAKSGGFANFGHGWKYVLTSLAEQPLVLLAPLALLVRRTRRAVGWFLAGASIWYGYQLWSAGDFYPRSRMLMPLIPALTVLGIVGLGALCRGLPTESIEVRRKVLAVLCAVLSIGWIAWVSTGENRNSVLRDWTFSRVIHWKATGELLSQKFPEDTLLAAVPIGAVGYYSGLPIVDLVGLTDRTIAREGDTVPADSPLFAPGHARLHTDYVLRRDPDLVMLTGFRSNPSDFEEPLTIGVPAEVSLLEQLMRRDGDMVFWSPELSTGFYGSLVVRESLADSLELENTVKLEDVPVRVRP